MIFFIYENQESKIISSYIIAPYKSKILSKYTKSK